MELSEIFFLKVPKNYDRNRAIVYYCLIRFTTILFFALDSSKCQTKLKYQATEQKLIKRRVCNEAKNCTALGKYHERKKKYMPESECKK